jgi:hypothetical protein
MKNKNKLKSRNKKYYKKISKKRKTAKIKAGNPELPQQPLPLPVPSTTKPCVNCEDGTDDYTYPNKENNIIEKCSAGFIPNKPIRILYITPRNVLIGSVETMQEPLFNVSLQNKKLSCKIKIEDLFINSFIYLCGDWYASMRFYGKNYHVYTNATSDIFFYKLKSIFFLL